jgi:hypothetical protein
MSDQEKGAVLAEALADYLGVEPESIRGFIFACERSNEGGLTLSSGWMLPSKRPYWDLYGYLEEAGNAVDRSVHSGSRGRTT